MSTCNTFYCFAKMLVSFFDKVNFAFSSFFLVIAVILGYLNLIKLNLVQLISDNWKILHKF